MGYPMAEELPADYQLFSSLAPVLSGMSLLCIAVSTYLIRDGIRSHDVVGKVGDVVGFVGYAATSAVDAHLRAKAAVDCSLYGRDCPTYDDSDQTLTGLIWNMVRVLFAGLSVKDLLLTGLAVLVGVIAANLTRRTASPTEA